MKNKILFRLAFLILVLSSCEKKQPNRINYFISISPTQKEVTLISSIGTLSREIVTDVDGIRRTSIIQEAFPFEISSLSGDTIYVDTRTRYNAHHVLGYEVELMGIKLFKNSDLIINEDDFSKSPMSDLEFNLEADAGQLVNVLLELDLDSSLRSDSIGNYTFEPVFRSTKLIR